MKSGFKVLSSIFEISFSNPDFKVPSSNISRKSLILRCVGVREAALPVRGLCQRTARVRSRISCARWGCAGDVQSTMGISTGVATKSILFSSAPPFAPLLGRPITRQWRPSACGQIPFRDRSNIGPSVGMVPESWRQWPHEWAGISKGMKEVLRVVQACRGWHRLSPAKWRLLAPLLVVILLINEMIRLRDLAAGP